MFRKLFLVSYCGVDIVQCLFKLLYYVMPCISASMKFNSNKNSLWEKANYFTSYIFSHVNLAERLLHSLFQEFS